MKRYFVLGLLLAASAHANRCEWDQLLNESTCCAGDEQAVWNPIYHEVQCVKSQSGDSCAFADIGEDIQCCKTDQHAVWNQLDHELECHTIASK